MSRHHSLEVIVCGLALLTPSALRGQAPSADQILGDAKVTYSQQGPKAALPRYEKALVAYRQAGNRLGQAITIGLMGNCYKRLGDYSKALELLNSSLSIKRELHERLEEGKTLSNLGLVYWEQADYPKAIQFFNESIAIGHETSNTQLEASALNNLSLVYDEQGDYRRSLEQYKKALELHRSINYEPGESDTLGNIGGVYLSLGRFSEAESYYRQALEISRRLESKISEAQDGGNIALCQFGEGKTKESLQSFNDAIALAKLAGMVKEEADWYRGKASVLVTIGEFDAALKNYSDAEAAYSRAGLKREESETLADSAAAYLTLGDRVGAERQLRRAISISNKIGYSRGVMLNQLSLAELQFASGDHGQAQRSVEAGLAGASKLDESDAIIQGLLLLGRILRDQHMYDLASSKATLARRRAHSEGLKPLEAEALDFSAELLLNHYHPRDAIAQLDLAKAIALETQNVELLWQVQFHRGQALEKLHKSEEAVAEYKAAIGTIEEVRAQIAERRFRTGYFQDKQHVYTALISLLLRLGRSREAFEFSERLREYSFLQLRQGIPGGSTPELAEAKARVRHLQEMLDAENRKAQAQQRSEAVRTYSDELATAQNELQALLDSKQPLAPQQSASPEAIQAALPHDAALLEYVVDDSRLTIFVLRRSGLQALVVEVRERDLRSKIELFRDLVSDPRDEAWEKPAASLTSLLIAPAERKGLLAGIHKLIVVSHGVLNYLPLAALPVSHQNRQEFLAQQFEITEVPSASWLLRPPRIQNSDSVGILALAPGQAGLKYAIPEAKRVATLFSPGSETLVGPHATETAFKSGADKYGIIHLATHGFFNRANPLFSGVQLEADVENDGRLEVHEVMALHLKAKLVTLSACDTALGGGDFSEIPAGDEFVGLSRAFLEAGSDAVLASLWKVNDRSSLVLMSHLYRSMKLHDGPAALSQAQRSMIADPSFRHPFYWAPFVFVGGEIRSPQIAAEKR